MPHEWTRPPSDTGPVEAELQLWPYRSLPKRGFAGFVGGTAALIALHASVETHADLRAFAAEVAQSTPDTPLSPRRIESALMPLCEPAISGG